MKDSYYFSHDSNAKDDPKCLMLIEHLGLEGYGIFWVLIEILRAQVDYRCPVAIIPAIARRYNTSTEKVRAVINGYNLFEVVDEQFFFSKSLINRMDIWRDKQIERRERAKIAATKRWSKAIQEPVKPEIKAMQTQCLSNANAMPEQCDCNATSCQESKVKESKVKEIKEKEIISNNEIEINSFLLENEILETTCKDFLISEEWLNIKAMQLGYRNGEIMQVAKDFLISIRDRDMISGRDLQELRRHFVSWAKKQPKPESKYIPDPWR